MMELLLDKDTSPERFDQEFASMVASYGAPVVGHEVYMGGIDDEGHSTDKPEHGKQPADAETGMTPPSTREHKPDPSDDGADDIDLDKDLKFFDIVASSGLLEYGMNWPEAESGDDDDIEDDTQDPQPEDPVRTPPGEPHKPDQN